MSHLSSFHEGKEQTLTLGTLHFTIISFHRLFSFSSSQNYLFFSSYINKIKKLVDLNKIYLYIKINTASIFPPPPKKKKKTVYVTSYMYMKQTTLSFVVHSTGRSGRLWQKLDFFHFRFKVKQFYAKFP